MLPNDIAGLWVRQQRRCPDAVADADGAVSRRRGEDQPDGARTAARRADAGDLLRADRSRSVGARQRRSAARIARRRWRCATTFPADGEYLFEMRPKESGAAAGSRGLPAEPHQLDIAIDNVRVGTVTLGGPDFAPARQWRAARLPDYPREDRNKKILDLMTVPRAGQVGLASGAGVLRREDHGASSKICSTRPCAASRTGTAAASPRISERDDHRSSARRRRRSATRRAAAAS